MVTWFEIVEKPYLFADDLVAALKEAEWNDPNSLIGNRFEEDEWNRDSEDGRVNLYASHWVDVEIGEIDGNVISWFLYGNCAVLAFEVAALLNKNLILFEIDNPKEGQQDWGHLAVAVEPGRVLDIGGFADISYYENKYHGSAREIDLTNPADYERLRGAIARDGENLDEAFERFYSPVERAVIRDYARIVAAMTN